VPYKGEFPVRALLSNKLILIGALLIVALIGFRLWLPYFLRDYVNNNLHQLKDYDGHVETIHVALWRGAYDVNSLVIFKRGATNNEDFFSVERLGLAIQWRALIRGSIVGEAVFEAPTINLIQSNNATDTQLGTDTNWGSALEKLFPFKFNQITIQRGTAKFRAPGINTGDALVLHDINASVSNLTNVVDANNEAFARFMVHGELLGKAPLNISGRINPYTTSPTFEVDAKLENVPLPQLNPWLKVYANVNADKGSFSMYSSCAAADRKFKGYVKPILREVEIVSIKEDANPLQKVWAVLVQGVATLLKNQSKDQLATKIPFSGTVENPDAGILETIINVLRNGFVAAFSHSIDQNVKLNDVTGGQEKTGSEDK
jgi:hypothetical protein